MSITSDYEFGFFFCVGADLRRYRAIMLGRPEKVPGWRLIPSLFSPRFMPVLLCRIAHACFLARLGFVGRIVSLINFGLFGIEIALRCRIGPGLILPHTQGTVIGSSSIGSDAIIFQGVTLGARDLDLGFHVERRPVVGSGVTIGAGAKIFGGIRLGDHSRVGANAVVLQSVPDGALAVGVPARIVPSAVSP